ncbi:MAG: TetR/AcrR family transcriptional regulator [Firmicutes bacterium]|nr:TetR/AcrR family transcriptional regulator [Bacillota bacterium]
MSPTLSLSDPKDLVSEEIRFPETGERLIDAAVRCFAAKWYGTVSVAEICREAGLSNGVFYRYFPDKEALFKIILGRVLQRVRSALPMAGSGTYQERLHHLAESMFRFSRDHADLITVFREGQYRFFEYERQLVTIYQRILNVLLERETPFSEYLYAFGGLRFSAIRWARGAAPIDLESTCRIVSEGLFPGLSFDPEKTFGGSALPLPVPLDADVHERLLQSGTRCFGEKGYFETNIHEVTSGAGLSVGSFYTHFPSKEAFYGEIVQRTGRNVRRFIAQNLAGPGSRSLNPLEYELRGLWLWIVYLAQDRQCYNLVREAEFVVPAVARDYYAAFTKGYHQRPRSLRLAQTASHVDEATAIDYLMGLAHYVGMETAFDRTPLNARTLIENIGTHLAHGVSPQTLLAPAPRR